MTTFAEQGTGIAGDRRIGPAVVVAHDAGRAAVHVELETDDGPRRLWARIAVPACPPLDAGDEVLVADDGRDGGYVVGVLTPPPQDTPPRQTAPQQRIPLGDGAWAAASARGDLQVFSARGDLLLDYDPATRSARVTALQDLQLLAPAGDMTLASAGRLRMAAAAVDVDAGSGIRLRAGFGGEQPRAELALEPRSAGLSAGEVTVTGARGVFHLQDTTWTGARFTGHLRHAKLVVGKLETIARTVLAKAGNVYQTVQQLAQLHAGRVRTIVQSTFRLKSRNAALRADEDFKVDANKIHLG